MAAVFSCPSAADYNCVKRYYNTVSAMNTREIAYGKEKLRICARVGEE